MWRDYTRHAHTIIAWKAKKRTHEREATFEQFLGHNSPLVAHTKLKTSRNVTGEQGSRLVCVIFAYTVYFSSYTSGRRKKEEERRKKMDKIEIFVFGFLQLEKG